MNSSRFSRRQALAACGSLLTLGSSTQAQTPQSPALIGEPPGRIPPAAELVNSLEFEQVAQRKLDGASYAEIAGSDRGPMDRITFNPRYMVNTTKLDLTTPLFGDNMYAPIVIGPVANLKRYHPDGELAMVRGAATAKTAMIVADQSSVPIEKLAAEAKAALWCQVYPGSDPAAARNRAAQAVKAGCKVVVITAGIPWQPAGAPPAPPTLVDWKAIDQVRQGLTVPVVLKGVMTPEEAQAAVTHGVQGIVVSNYGGRSTPATASGILALPAISSAVGGKVPIMVDGGFRRGSDVLKALALGAQAVLMARPAVWSMAAYGADGVQSMLYLIQNEVAREMVMCGLVNMKAMSPAAVTIHRR
jgi:4-hydroxymandelate oxidase